MSNITSSDEINITISDKIAIIYVYCPKDQISTIHNYNSTKKYIN
ncbi:hypothetical protein PAND9192_02302 [Photobacterium andalusiense]|uniref:Uncharacterized protein n=1 Tax=Photobacterium andalusiense TaxID=2204296 RepID=A0A1Y6MHE9_9GAMM|nr:hypothetical protein PAND9192_02302 [Photobacterium andalusiense]